MVTLNRAFDELMNCLKSISGNNLPLEKLRPLLKQHLEEFTVKDHNPLVVEGDIPKYFYFQISGTTYLNYHDAKGNMHAFRFYREGKIILRKSYLLQEPSPCNMIATKGSLMFRLSYRKLKLILTELPGTLELLMYTVMEYDANKQRMREDMLSKDATERVAAFYRKFPKLLPANRVRLDVIISSYLCISPVWLRKTRKKLGLN
ncbi:MAG: Crp/Fnr family transcriptional regulator [Pedobacter sp.]|nr:MAG: Crp/Fnr family transcriptional regulator [Pedobacter sp.]